MIPTTTPTRVSVNIVDKKLTQCGKCGLEDLHWNKTGNGYRLFDGTGKKHSCYILSLDGQSRTLKRKRFSITVTFGGNKFSEEVIAASRDGAVLEVAATLASRFNRKDSIETVDKVRKTRWTPETVFELIRTDAEAMEGDHVSDEQLNDPDYGHDTITRQNVIDLAMEIIPIVVTQFYPSNKAVYQRLQFEPQDIEQHLYEKVLMLKYLPFMERRPQYYKSLSNLRKSFYIACKYACLAHYRMHVQSICRGSILNAPVLELDNGDVSWVSLAGEIGSDHLPRLCRMIDSCPCLIAQRMLFFIGFEEHESKATLRKRFPISRDEFDSAWDRMATHVSRWRDELVPARPPAVHHVRGGRQTEHHDPEISPYMCRVGDDVSNH